MKRYKVVLQESWPFAGCDDTLEYVIEAESPEEAYIEAEKMAEERLADMMGDLSCFVDSCDEINSCDTCGVDIDDDNRSDNNPDLCIDCDEEN